MSKTLNDRLNWQRYSIGAGAANGAISLAVGEVRGGDGPTALITAGIHGDEGPWGGWAVHKLLSQTPVSDLLGTLRIVPAANPLAMEADARNAPLDTLDLNRVFPGDKTGSHTERLAAALVEHTLPGLNVVIDLHGGGSWCINAFVFEFTGSEDLARAFPAPFIVSGPDRAVTLTGYARTQGIRAAAVEMGGRSQNEAQWAERIAAGLRRALGIAGVLTPVTEPAPAAPIPVGPTVVLRPERGGVFIPELRADAVGTVLPKDTVLGRVVDPATYQVLETFRAPFEPTALLLMRPAVARVEGGAMMYVVAEPR
jgi:hypothetical protein